MNGLGKLVLRRPRCGFASGPFWRLGKKFSGDTSVSALLSAEQRSRTLPPCFWRDFDLKREDVQPVCNDRHAGILHEALLQPAERAALEENAHRDVEADIAAVHGAFIDRMALDAVGRRVKQLVFVGSGMDTRACRLDLQPQVRLVEVDEKPVSEAKGRVLDAAGVRPRCIRRCIDAASPGFAASAELPVEGLAGVLDVRRPSLFVLDGWLLAAWTSMCPERIETALADLGAVAGDGSRIVAQVCSSAENSNAADMAAATRESLQAAGWERTDLVGARAFSRLFARAPPPDARAMLVVAERGAAQRPGRPPPQRQTQGHRTGPGPREVGF